MSTWRDKAAPLIAQVLKEHQGADEAEINKALRDAYPFGPRQHHPYKIWRDEIARQRGKKPPLGSRTKHGLAKGRDDVPGQADLFGATDGHE